MRRLLLTALAAATPAVSLGAQGAISIQGFGYPSGQISARASGTAGAIAETDPGSPLNPASPIGAGKSIFAFQIDPEFRRMMLNGNAINTTTARFPVLTAGVRVGATGFLNASFSSLLDRSWTAWYNDSVNVGGDRVASSILTTVRGAINDARLAFSWQFGERLQVGGAFHAITGANHIQLARNFTDSTTFGSLAQTTTLAFQGTAVSAGVLAVVVPHVVLAASLRVGGAMSTRYNDSVATHGKAPDRYGASLTYDGIPGSQLAIRYNHEKWTNMTSLGSASLDVHDVTELSAGADIAGPKIRLMTTQFRIGARKRDLPFGWQGNVVSERTLAAGAGLTFARGWATLDASFAKNQRQSAALREQGTILSVGLTVRP